MRLDYLLDKCKEVIAERPHLRGQIQETYYHAVGEIDCGGAEENEVDHALQYIQELIEFDVE